MSLKIGIVGLPNVGKSTLFKALTKQSVEIANYPFATIDPNVGVVSVPDERLGRLSAMSKSKRTIPAIVEFVDIAGLVKGASEGAGLGNAFLSHIREVDAIAEVVRVFDDPDIIHIEGAVDPLSDIDVMSYELIMKDLETVLKRLVSIERDARAGKKDTIAEKRILEVLKAGLEKGTPARAVMQASGSEREEYENVFRGCSLLSAKPILYVLNTSERMLEKGWTPDAALREKIGSAPCVVISAKVEADLSDMTLKEGREYLSALGVRESGLQAFIRIGYETLKLITFFTTGEDETRAWTIPRGSRAPRAGRAIHSDFEEKFIRAEIISWEKLLEAGSWAHARKLGVLRTEGKEYIVKDGDVVEFKI